MTHSPFATLKNTSVTADDMYYWGFMEASSVFNHVRVIESLPESGSKTGQWSYDDQLLHSNPIYPSLTSELIQVTRSLEFANYINRVREAAE